ncbi:MAG: phage major tail tube protein [Roseibium sp.]
MSELPAYILRDCTIFVDKESKIGQCSEITLPVPEKKQEEVRNAGMIKPRRVSLGYEALELAFKMTSFDPQVIKLFGLAPGIEKQFMATGALVDEDGTVHSAVITMNGDLTKPDAGRWKTGELSENDYMVNVNSYKLEVEGEVLLEMDDFDISSGGVSQQAAIRNALLV